MYQDPNFSPNSTEDLSNIPQLPFPDPIDALQDPFPAAIPTQPATIPGSPQPFLPEQATPAIDFTQIPSSPQLEQATATFPGLQQPPFPIQPTPILDSTQSPNSPQLPFPAYPTPIPDSTQSPNSPQLPFPAHPTPAIDSTQSSGSPQSTTAIDYMKNPHAPQQLPSTETVDIKQIHRLQQMSLSNGDAQQAWSQTSLATEAGTQAMFARQPSLTQMPGLVEIPITTTQSLPAVAPGTAQLPKPVPSNQDAKRAIINGVISIIVSTFTLLTIAGFAGLIIGTFAIIYGIMGLRLALFLPNKVGWRQAVVGIALGLIAWCIVIAAATFHVPLSS